MKPQFSISGFVLALALVMGGTAFAQEGTTTAGGGTTDGSTAGATGTGGTSGTTSEATTSTYDTLSPGNQKIVDSMYDAQQPTTDPVTGAPVTDPVTGEAVLPMTKEDIAALGTQTGWGNAYKQMCATSTCTYRNLGQAIKAHNMAGKTPPAFDSSISTTNTVVTTGNGQQIQTGDTSGSDTGAQSFKSSNAGNHGGGNGNGFGHSGDTTITTGSGASFGGSASFHSSAGGLGGGFGGSGGSKGRGHGGSSH